MKCGGSLEDLFVFQITEQMLLVMKCSPFIAAADASGDVVGALVGVGLEDSS